MTVGGLIRTCRTLCDGPRAQDGTTAIEYGFILPGMLLTIYGIIELGRVLFVQTVLLFAAEEATRYATVNYDATIAEIQDVAEARFMLMDATRITTFDVQSQLDPVDQTKLVSVEIVYAHEALMPMPWDTVTLTGSSRGFIVDE